MRRSRKRNENMGNVRDNGNGRQTGGDLQIVEERVLCEIPRGTNGEALRVTFTRAKTSNGAETAWHAIREFWRDDAGQLRPGKKGITIRGKELRPVLLALADAAGARLVKADRGTE